MAIDTRTAEEPIDEEKLNKLLGVAVTDFGATAHAPLVVIGDKLGLYEALAYAEPLTSAGLAEETDTAERYVREWLRSQAAGGYVTYDPETDRYTLTPEQAAVLADENGPAFLPSDFQVALSAAKIEPQLAEAFRTGEGVGWHEHDAGLFPGTERSFRPNYAANLVQSWIPALDGVDATLEAGGRVADVGCGHGASTILMADAYPESTFVGIDYHEESIATARERAADAGVADRVSFEVATAKSYNGASYDFVATFDAFHDMGDPVGAAAHVRDTLTDDGTWMLVEPYANDLVEDNLNPLGRVFYSVSTLVCTPGALDQEGERVLGAQAGEADIREVVTDGGFTQFYRAAETPMNLVFEAKP
ncbi:class I SAM-dependent methyltransferase [Halococcus sp. AFM35]|uniref:class I SAM-dependent methyltransferase n=1 Tax=Halococcus sp. AFM35 TaxID=3421653 RepID=UPI003EBA7BC2